MSVINSKFTDVDIPEDVSIVESLRSLVQKYQHKPALIDSSTGDSCTYSSFYKSVRNIGGALYRLGLRKGDVVLYTSTNCLETMLFKYGILSIGGIVATCNPNSKQAEMTRLIRDCQPVYGFTQPETVDKLREAGDAVQCIKTIFVTGEHDGCVSVSSFRDADHQDYPDTDVEINPREDIAFILYSSGTSGPSKGVLITHYSVVSAACFNIKAPGHEFLQTDDVMMCPFPMFHIGGISGSYFSLYAGATFVFADKPNIEPFLQAIEKYRVTSILVHPPMMVEILKIPEHSRPDLSSIKTFICGAAPFKAQLSRSVETCFQNLERVTQIYGMTECNIGLLRAPLRGWKHGALGVVGPNCQVKICDMRTGAIVPRGHTGHLYVRTPALMKCYLNNPTATAEAMCDDGWLATGDMVYVDEDDHIFHVDRFKELIKYNNEGNLYSIAPADIEDLLLDHPDVTDAAVIGVPDLEFETLPKAFIVKRNDATLNEKTVQQYVEDNASDFKKLRGGVQFVDTIPKTASGKILRRILRAQHKVVMR